jgi:Cu(I)/Ag(I) efflux system membrane protein CusA/SilA
MGGQSMIENILRWSVHNRFFVLLATFILVGAGAYSLKNTPVDAIPDLSDVQVIIKTSYPGQAPQVVEDQVTYPLTTAMLSVPGAVTVRGFSFFGDSYVYVIFDEDTDAYWARSRVLEYLSQVAPTLPPNARPQLGPDATGVGWVYLYALVDRSGKHDLSQLRSLQDWFLKCYPQDYRDSPEQLSLLPIVTPTGQRIALADVARVFVEDGPPAIKSENARLKKSTRQLPQNV